jgi:hypothetical protein
MSELEARFRDLEAALQELDVVEDVDVKLGGARDALRVTFAQVRSYGSSVPEEVALPIYEHGLAIHTAQGRTVGVVAPEQDLPGVEADAEEGSA